MKNKRKPRTVPDLLLWYARQVRTGSMSEEELLAHLHVVVNCLQDKLQLTAVEAEDHLITHLWARGPPGLGARRRDDPAYR